MITKAKRLKCIGKFYEFSATRSELDWHKNTFVFAPNAYGNGAHHGEIIDATAKKLSRDELLPLLREALDLVQKV